jgi:protein phosphatase
MKIPFSARSHMGHVRTNNEDNLYCNGLTLTPETREAPFFATREAAAPCVFAVCDGMGGQADGEDASLSAVRALKKLEKAIKHVSSDKIDGIVQAYVKTVSDQLCDKMRQKRIRTGTTLALAAVTEREVRLYNIGDSRIYALSNDRLRQISEDHTVVAQKIKMGVLTPQQAAQDRDRHILTRHIGLFEDEMIMEADPLPPLPTTERHRLLLCSDGLTDMVTDEQIAVILRTARIEEAAERLTAEALANGGKDNITCIVLDIGLNAGKTKTGAGAFIDPAIGLQTIEAMRPQQRKNENKFFSFPKRIINRKK